MKKIPFLTVLIFVLAANDGHASCDLKEAGTATIVEILNTDTLLLEDGRALRLVGILAPRTQTRWAKSLGLRERLISALQKHALGRQVKLRFGERKRDRYGRLLTHIFVDESGEDVWLQEMLIRDGLAMAYSFEDNRDCIRALQEEEAAARANGAGLWETGILRVRNAADPASMNALSYSFQIVEGRVSDVADIRGRVYINFGEDWRTDFTASIAPSHRDNFEGSNIKLTDLKGHRLRVRGWLKRRNGPLIEVSHPEQIELVGAEEPISSPSTQPPASATIEKP